MAEDTEMVSQSRPGFRSRTNRGSFVQLEKHREQLKQSKSTPILAFSCLFVATLTTIISLGILLGVRNKPVWPSNGVYGFMQPASWLSVLLSLAGICLDIALGEGVSIMWWRQASKETATVEELHLAWAAGTSYLDAVRTRAWKRYKYITFATLAVLLVPINGFLLQGAISTKIVTQHHNVNITIPMVPFLDPGFSGYNIGFGDVLDLSGAPWSAVWAQVQNILGSKNAQYAYVGTLEDHTNSDGESFPFNYDNSSIYTTHAEGAGFDVSCESYTTYHNFTPTAEKNITGGRIFSATVAYDLAKPNKMTLDVFYKNESSCAFHLIGKRCNLTAATVVYPIQVQMNISSSAYSGPFYSLQDGTTRQDDKTVSILPVFPGEGDSNWTYAGIANSLGAYYNSTIDIIDYLDETNSSWIANGQLADTLDPDYNGDDNIYYCEITFVDGLNYLGYLHSLDEPTIDYNTEIGWGSDQTVNLAEMILNRIREAMFLSSVYMGAEWYTELWTNFGNWAGYTEPAYGKSHYIQERPAVRATVVAIYDVRLYLWAISLAITVAVVVIIIPLFWRYWDLTREPSMSPVDLARAFHAPMLAELDPEADTRDVLHVVGTRSVHRTDAQVQEGGQGQDVPLVSPGLRQTTTL